MVTGKECEIKVILCAYYIRFFFLKANGNDFKNYNQGSHMIKILERSIL